jgi:hypothetical protein
MNSRLTIAVLFILIILVGVVAYVSRQPKPAAHAVKHEDVFTPHPTSLKSFSYQRANGPLLSFLRKGTHWFITSPIKARGRDYAIGDLASTLANLKWRYRSRITSSGSHSLAQTGLQNPKAILTLTDQAGKTFTLHIGSQNATGRLYVHLAGVHDPYVDVVKADWLSRLDRPVRKFRNRSLASFHTSNIAAITLRMAGKTVRIVPHNKAWLITQPLLAPAATSAVTSWISNLQLLTAHRFSAVPAARAGFKNGPLTITVDFKTPKPLAPATAGAKKTAIASPPAPAPLVIQFGIKTDLTGKFYYAQSSYNPGVCVVRNTSFTQLRQSLSQLRDHHLVAANVTKASRIVITRTSHLAANTPASMTLDKINGQWTIHPGSGPGIPGSATAISKLLNTLHTVKAKSFIDHGAKMANMGFSHPMATWNITIPQHVHSTTLTFGTIQKSGLIPVRVAQWPSIYMVSPTALKPLLPMCTALRSKTVTDLTGAMVHRITIRQAGRTVTLNNAKGKWLTAAKLPAQRGQINNLLSAWKPLSAKKWFVNARTASSVPPVTVDVTIFKPLKPASPPATAGKKPSSAAKPRYRPQHEVLTLWRINVPVPPAGKMKVKATVKPSATTQWRAELSSAGAAAENPVWSFQPTKSLVSDVQAFLEQPLAKPAK